MRLGNEAQSSLLKRKVGWGRMCKQRQHPTAGYSHRGSCPHQTESVDVPKQGQLCCHSCASCPMSAPCDPTVELTVSVLGNIVCFCLVGYLICT